MPKKKKKKRKGGSRSTPAKKQLSSHTDMAEISSRDTSDSSLGFFARLQRDGAASLARLVENSPLIIGYFSALGLPRTSTSGEVMLFMLLSAAVILLIFKAKLVLDAPYKVVLYCLALIAQMSVYAILGGYIWLQSESVFVFYIFGFVPGCVLASALVARHASVLEEAGWKRSIEKKNRKGEVRQRPGGVSRLFSIFLIISPAIVFMLAAGSMLPPQFLLVALILLFSPDIADTFQRRAIPDVDTARKSVNISAISAVIMLFIGLI